MTAEDIRSTVADFGAAARNAVEAGFAGVEVHAANGFLLHQFLAKGTNLRTDEWGGPVENRIRLTVEVVRAVAEAIGPERVGVRISPGIANQLLSREQFAADGGKSVAEGFLAEGADLVSLGRGFLANPDFVERLRTDAPLNEIRTEFLMHVQGAEGYYDYPALATASV